MKPMSPDFHSRRSMIVGQRGMVATSNPLASQAGLAVLRAGGNAADAAIAAAAVLNVTEPASTGIGGDMFALYYDARTRQVTGLNGSGRAPAGSSAADLRARGWTTIPPRSAHAVTVPGAARGWEDLLRRHGTMPLSAVLADAITYARDGFPVHPVFSEGWGRSGAVLEQGYHTEEYLPGGRPPRAGEVVRLPGLARTLQAVAEGGADAFYHGDIADAIVRTLNTLGSPITHADLAAHESTWVTPISTVYRGVQVHEIPPNGQGIAALIALNVLSEDDLAALPWHAPDRLHLMVEAMRIGFAEAGFHVADPASYTPPIDYLLSADYARQRRAQISAGHAHPGFSHSLPPIGADTVYLCTADAEGSACSFINSLYMGFGSAIVAQGTGVFLQNRGANFVLEAGHPNEFAPGKRPYHTIIPALATEGDALWGVFGVMGGFMQPQGHVQVISAMLDDQLNPQEALNRPRWCLELGDGGYTLALEDGIPVETMARLAEYGHRVRPVSGWGRGVFGDGQIIRRDRDAGVWLGGSDPRKDGQTAAY
ncbi:gamma-glutamyltransferase family protein [Anaerolineae bacterium CFX9]|nr:gamma-glutamyltransferase family protein [Anaerolineae bacterium CFX9]